MAEVVKKPVTYTPNYCEITISVQSEGSSESTTESLPIPLAVENKRYYN